MSDAWDKLQAELKNMPGPEGIKRRQEAYPPFFQAFGSDVVIEEGCSFIDPQRIALADRIMIHRDVILEGTGSIAIGSKVLIEPRVTVLTADHDTAPGPTALFEREPRHRPVTIGSNVVIGAVAVIEAGAHIADDSVVTSGAAVGPGRYPSRHRLSGNPASCEPLGAIPAWDFAPDDQGATAEMEHESEDGYWRDRMKAARAVSQSDPAAAIKAFQAIRSARPDWHAARSALASAAYKAKDWVLAEAEAREAVRLRPDVPLPFVVLARVLDRQGRLPEAEAHWREALRLDPSNAAWHAGFGTVCQRLGKLDDAVEALRRAIALQDGAVPPSWLRNLGTCLLRLGRDAEAADAFRSAERIEPGPGASVLRELDRRLSSETPVTSAEFTSSFFDDLFANSETYRKNGRDTVYRPLWEAIVAHIEAAPGRRIIDIGCGPGQFAEFLAERVGDIDYTGIDFSGVAIRQARERCPSMRFEEVDFFKTDMLRSSDYDIVVCTEFLEHVEMDVKVFQEMRAGTLFLGSVPSFYAFSHVRFFKSADEVISRYGAYLDEMNVSEFLIESGASLFFIRGRKRES